MRLEWIDENECRIGDLPVRFAQGGYDTLRTTSDNVWVLKGRSFFDRYPELLGGEVPGNVLEIGIFEGGSALIFAEMWPEARIAAVDIRDPNPELQEHVRTLGHAGRLQLHYNVSQGDRDAMERVIAQGFGGAPIDLVIDDASHHYDLTRKSFEIVFPHLRPGGLYIVEDWAWAHWRNWQGVDQWKNDPALTNLLFELVMASASTAHVISEVVVNASLFMVRKAPICPPLEPGFRLEDQYVLRGRPLPLI